MNIENRLILVKKYSKAFVNTFKDKLSIDDIDLIENLIHYLKQNRNIFIYINLSIVEFKIKKDFFSKLIKLFKLKEFFTDLTNLLLESNRIFLLIYILKDIIKIYMQEIGFIKFNIVSSHNINNKNLEIIKNFLKNKTGKNILTRLSIDKSLIAGIKIYSDELAWQYSIKNYINAIKQIN